MEMNHFISEHRGGNEFPFLNADGLNPLRFLALKKKKNPKAAAICSVGRRLITLKTGRKIQSQCLQQLCLSLAFQGLQSRPIPNFVFARGLKDKSGPRSNLT
jgi:hypothetical protein